MHASQLYAVAIGPVACPAFVPFATIVSSYIASYLPACSLIDCG